MADANILAPVTVLQVTLGSGNVWQLASQYLGDATQADRIMAINPQLSGDPWFVGTQTINIPGVLPTAGTGGIIGPIPASTS